MGFPFRVAEEPVEADLLKRVERERAAGDPPARPSISARVTAMKETVADEAHDGISRRR